MVVLDRQHQQGGEPASRTSSNFEQRIYAPQTIAAIVAELAAQGHAASAALDGTGLTEAQLGLHTTKVSYRQLDRVVRNALGLTDDPAIALRVGQRMHVTAYGMYGYALLSSATYAEATTFSGRYIRVIGPFCDITLSNDGAAATCVFEPLYWPNRTEDVHRFAVEFALSAHLTVTRDWAGDWFSYSRVFLDYAAVPYTELYDSLFRCPVFFEQPTSGYDYALRDDSVALADQRSHAMAREMCEQLLAEVNRGGGVAADIRRLLIEQPGRYPSIEAVAEKFGMYPRALRRRLEAEGTSYRDLLAEVRTRLAIEYLRKTQMTNEEIATRLGYSDAANFRHAFTRWTGKSPSEFRGT